MRNLFKTLKPIFYITIFQLVFFTSNAQNFTRQDTLRGSITPEREWWDLIYYHLNITVDLKERSIKGSNTIRYKVLKEAKILQVDLQPPMEIIRIEQQSKDLSYKKDGNVWFVELKDRQKPGEIKEIKVFYEGKPKVSKNPPWDGGFTWKKDKKGKPFAASSCQGEGASLWWPCKDHMYDEPDSMLISVTVPSEVMDVSNGKLIKVVDNKDDTKTWNWFVSNPINNYGVNVNIADYANFSEQYDGEKGKLECNYYVLQDNLEKAKEHFNQVKLMLKAFEYWFGPYPFYEDGYKLVEVPYLGMEHQSSVTYGNGYSNGYEGYDLSRTGWGLKFDFIIVHESGHEWFANNITYKDIADMWIHESFTAYSENLYLDYYFGKNAAREYTLGTRMMIMNDKPIIGFYDVNNPGSQDMYYKGANMLLSLQAIVNDDDKWRSILRGLNSEFYHKTVSTKQIEDYISDKTGLELKPFFDQYLRDTRIPVLEYINAEKGIVYRWGNCVEDFDMPVKVFINEKEIWLTPKREWQFKDDTQQNRKLRVAPVFYVGVFNLEGD